MKLTLKPCYVCSSPTVRGKNLCAKCLVGVYRMRGIEPCEELKIEARKCRSFSKLPDASVPVFDNPEVKHPKQLGRVRSSWGRIEGQRY